MRLKPGQISKRAKVFVEHMIRTNDATYAADKAGYQSPAVSGWKLMQNELVVAATREGTERFLRDKGGPIGVMVLAELALDPKMPANTRRAAAKDLAVLGGMTMADSSGKELSEMSGEELAREIARATARSAAAQHVAAERARPVIDGQAEEVEPVEDEQPEVEPDAQDLQETTSLFD